MPGTTRSARRGGKATDDQPDQAPISGETTDTAPTDGPANAEEQAAAAQGAPAPVDFLALLTTAEDDRKASRKSDERADIEVPEEWVAKVKDTYENRKRVRIPGITTKELYGQVGDLIRAAADRIQKSATVRAVYTLPEGVEDKPENRVLTALTFTVGPRRKGPQGKKNAPATVPESDTSTTGEPAGVDASDDPSGD